MLILDATVVRNADILGARVGEESVLMSAKSGQYYALAATSHDIWDRIQEPIRVRDLCTALASFYQAPLDLVQADTLEFLDYLNAQNMIEVRA